ncbi:hypothetical protein QW060_19445 [Myroides ceti]|uniref:Uncharacterized protein n=1 Tax=Paenimyroides ceti TaxID=395087 RepID=A0ABT8CZX2_9FLAO|nr:hypothetical protein [Paenimyroides ceti]MDN3709208.1 hypothetical protein [Paenimyroides ceti]
MLIGDEVHLFPDHEPGEPVPDIMKGGIPFTSNATVYVLVTVEQAVVILVTVGFSRTVTVISLALFGLFSQKSLLLTVT